MRQLALVEDAGLATIKRPETRPDLTAAVTAAALAGAGAGNVNNGAHSYLVTFVTAQGETDIDGEDLGQVSVTVAALGTNGQVALSAIPVGSSFVTARKIYRTKAGADPNFVANYFLLATIANNSATTYTDNTADASLDTAHPAPTSNTTLNTIFSFDALNGLNPAALLLSGVGAAAAYPKTTSGAQTLLAAHATIDRIVLIIVSITETFANGDGAKPSFNLGETSTATKFKSGLTSGTAGDKLVYAGTLSATKALLVTGTAGTGTTETGAIAVAVLVLPAAS
jgi:hypothetical protein